MNRREFLTKAGEVVALAAMAGEAELINMGCQSGGYLKTTVAKPNFEVAAEPQFPKVVLAPKKFFIEAVPATIP